MRKTKIAKWVCLVAILVLVVLSIPSPVSAVEESDLEELSTHIVIGVVEDIDSEWNSEETQISTYVTVSVEQYLKGNGPPTITIEALGGVIGNRFHFIPSEAEYVLGERIKVYLQKHGCYFYVVEGRDGKVTLVGGSGGSEPSSDGTEIGYKRSTDYGYPLYWETPIFPIQYYINEYGTEDCEGEFDAVRFAFNTWEDEPYSFVDFSYMGFTNKFPNIEDNTNVVGWLTRSFDTRAAFAVTMGSIVNGIYEVREVDIIFNDYCGWGISPPPWELRHDVQNIATHEVGHLLCFDELKAGHNAEETMYHNGLLWFGETKKRDLGDGDIAGVRRFYPHPRNGGTFLEKPYDSAFTDGHADWGASHMEDADPVTGTLKYSAQSGLLFQWAWSLASVRKTYTPTYTLCYPKIIYAVHFAAFTTDPSDLSAFCKIYDSDGNVVAEDWQSIYPSSVRKTQSFVFDGPQRLWTPPHKSYYTFEIGIKAEVMLGGWIDGWSEGIAPSYALWVEVFQEVYDLTVRTAWTTGQEVTGVPVHDGTVSLHSYTPVTWTVCEGRHRITLPLYLVEPDGLHAFRYWSDGLMGYSYRDVDVDSDMTIIGYYDANPS